MKVDKVTITGADDKTDLAELYALWLHYPFVEWGVLFSKSREGSPRYPTATKITEIASYQMPLSAHFCGWYSQQIMEAQNFKLIDDLPSDFKRVQLNYNFSKSIGWQIKWVVDYAASNQNRSLIFQVNGSNMSAINMIAKHQRSNNIHYLYDSSGGRGTALREIDMPFMSYTSYSGGIGPHNVEEVMDKIYKYKSPQIVGIDMESGVRTENMFAPEKVNDVLFICNKFIKTSPTFTAP